MARSDRVQVTSVGQQGGITAQNVSAPGRAPSPSSDPALPRWTKWVVFVAVIVSAGVGVSQLF